MSSPDNARRAYVRVKFEGADITKDISPYLISATYTDNEEDKADDLQLQLQDRESVWLEKWLNETKKSRAWERYTLSGIAGKIAGLYGMTLMYESGLDPFYTRVEQIKTSDIQFLETLCHNAGLALKITGNTIVLFDQADYEARAAVYTIRRGGGAYTKYKLGAGTADVQYASCRVSYTGPDGRCVSAVAWAEDYDAKARNNQQLEITAKTDSPDQARTLAEKILRRHNRYAKTASFTLPGGYSLVAGVTVRLECWGGWDGKYIVTQAKHTVDGSGYTVDVNLRKVLEGY